MILLLTQIKCFDWCAVGFCPLRWQQHLWPHIPGVPSDGDNSTSTTFPLKLTHVVENNTLLNARWLSTEDIFHINQTAIGLINNKSISRRREARISRGHRLFVRWTSAALFASPWQQTYSFSLFFCLSFSRSLGLWRRKALAGLTTALKCKFHPEILSFTHVAPTPFDFSFIETQKIACFCFV